METEVERERERERKAGRVHPSPTGLNFYNWTHFRAAYGDGGREEGRGMGLEKLNWLGLH